MKTLMMIMILVMLSTMLSAIQLTSRRDYVPYEVIPNENDEIQVSCSIWGVKVSDYMLERLNLDSEQYRRFKMLETRFENNRLHLNRMIEMYQQEINNFGPIKDQNKIDELHYLIDRTRRDIQQNWSNFNQEVIRILNPQQSSIWFNMMSQVCGNVI